MIQKSLLLTAFIFLSLKMIFAGITEVPTDSTSYVPKPYLGIHVGSFGGGLQFAYPISSMIALRATGSFLPSVSKTLTGTEEGAAVTTDIDFKTGGAGLIADFSFIKNKPGIRVSIGALYNATQTIVNRTYYIESNDVDLGSLNLKFTPNYKVSPYLGVVLGNLKNSKRVFFSMDMGVLYHGKPQVEFTGVGHISPTANESNTSIIENNVKSVQFYPYMNLQLNFKL